MDEEKERSFALVMEVSAIAFVLALSIGLGLLVAPWLGFIAFAGFVLLFMAVLMASYRKASKEAEAKGEGDLP